MATTNSIDPVCGMELTPGQIEAQSQYEGKRYDFCSVECKRLFDENPKKYVDETSAGRDSRLGAPSAP